MKENKEIFNTSMYCVDIQSYFNWPKGKSKGKFWTDLKDKIILAPKGNQKFWGIPFKLGHDKDNRVILANSNINSEPILLNKKADYLCFLHQWIQMENEIKVNVPIEGLVVGEYRIKYSDGQTHTQMIRVRFETGSFETGNIYLRNNFRPPWVAVPYKMYKVFDPAIIPENHYWAKMQMGVSDSEGAYLVYAMSNPHTDKKIKSLKIKGLKESPLVILGLTLYQGKSHPLRHLPRRSYYIKATGKNYKIETANVDLGLVARIEKTPGNRDSRWLQKPVTDEKEGNGKEVLHLVGSEDATVSVRLNKGGKKEKHSFSLGEAYYKGKSRSGNVSLEILNRKKQWLKVKIIDSSTGKPTPVRIHFSGKNGQYIAPHGHHEQINTNSFEDYGADVSVGGRNFAYVPGTFTTDLPVGDIYLEISKGFEYRPIRQKINIRPGQKELNLKIDRWIDLRKKGWLTADTHVHFISPQTAWLEGQAEGVNVVNLLATQLGRLFTNVGDYTGRVGVVEDDTIVYVGTENRNHMLGHMSMLGTRGLPVYPMCCGQPTEGYVGDPEFMMMTDWALENKRKGGLVIRPHFPICGHTEDPVPIIKGLVDALEVRENKFSGFPFQEWYRYLNCGYKVAVCGGTDKMGAYADLGWLRTYALLDKDSPFNYKNWTEAVRAGRTISTTGPLLDLYVDGRHIGDTIQMGSDGGMVEIRAVARSFWPLKKLEIVYNGRTVASTRSVKGENLLKIKDKIRIDRSGWLAARCQGGPALRYGRPFDTTLKRIRNAHTSPVYIKCGDTRAFDEPAAEHMLALVEGGIEYLNTIATMFDEAAQKRMVKQFKEVQQELKIRLVKKAGHTHHYGSGIYHRHG